MSERFLSYITNEGSKKEITITADTTEITLKNEDIIKIDLSPLSSCLPVKKAFKEGIKRDSSLNKLGGIRTHV